MKDEEVLKDEEVFVDKEEEIKNQAHKVPTSWELQGRLLFLSCSFILKMQIKTIIRKRPKGRYKRKSEKFGAVIYLDEKHIGKKVLVIVWK